MSVAAAPASKTVPLAGLRAAIARSMQSSWQAPHVTLSLEANADKLEHARQRILQETGQKISVTACIVKLCALTLDDHPQLNARLQDKQIEYPGDIHIGIAVDLNPGLMVPVLKNANHKSLSQIALELTKLAEAARLGSLTAGAYQGGTFTISSLTATEVEVFTPILNPPQVAVLGVTRIRPRPIVDNNKIVSANMLGLHLSFDHRALDGAPAGRFLSDLKQRIASGQGL